MSILELLVFKRDKYIKKAGVFRIEGEKRWII